MLLIKIKVVWDSLGALRIELAKQLELLDKNEYRFVWITEFPLLEWSEEQNRFVAMHHPFTMPMEEDLQYIDSDPGRVRAKAYDIVLNGNEIGGGSVRIFDQDIQSKMFKYLDLRKNRLRSSSDPSDSIQIRSTAARRIGLRSGPSGYADGKRGQHPRRHRIPEGKRCI